MIQQRNVFGKENYFYINQRLAAEYNRSVLDHYNAY